MESAETKLIVCSEKSGIGSIGLSRNLEIACNRFIGRYDFAGSLLGLEISIISALLNSIGQYCTIKIALKIKFNNITLFLGNSLAILGVI